MTIERYNYNDEPSGRSETLVQALEKIERLEKQLEIAIKALEIYADKTNWDNHFTIEINNCEIEVITFIEGTNKDGEFYAEKALNQIKELEK